MAGGKQPGRMKRRTREHIIADLSANHVERFVLRRGFSVIRTDGSDYGIDRIVLTFDDTGAVESGELLFQLKATDRLPILSDGRTISIPVAIADLKYWLSQPWPVILVVYDAKNDRAYWLYVQRYANGKGIDADDVASETVQVRIPLANRVSDRAVRQFRELKERILSEIKGVDHGE